MTTAELPKRNFIIITGLSGSGMSSATNAFEDLGYFCVDNLPIALLPQFAKLLLPKEDESPSLEKVALVIDIRERHFLSDFDKELEKLVKKGLRPYVLFFEASDEVLMRRFSETRRPHPFDKGEGLEKAIKEERIAMGKVRQKADQIIDTSDYTVHTLRKYLTDSFRQEKRKFLIEIVSFGHKHGLPSRLDLLFDVRHLPNPYFIPELKNLPGNDPEVVRFFNSQPEVQETIEKFLTLIEYLLPKYEKENKSYLTIGIGCTGGRHRSVRVAEAISETLKSKGYDVIVFHRDISREKPI
ncbi:MAG: RNase adapter RapZ [Pyrinomonadaceae bacterium]|nr:RNase adapter RapZ [Pyrinomonadaceae bacterium]MCX7639737.1 RNase adapter RapZ [Pyrinomonadaceae bacterium]MDW8304320.1 RNase adapter RapZ [Acidobacteriota bacterium]